MTTPDTASTPSASLNENMTQLTRELRGLAHDHLELAVLEARLSVNVALLMAVIAIVVALALTGAWMALAGSAVLGLIALGLAPALAMLVLAAANCLLAVIGWFLIRHKSRSLGWPATLRALKPETRPASEEMTP